MTKEFVPYQESLELKELGFDEPCFGFRSTNGNYRRFISDLGTNKDLENLFGDEVIECSTAPTFSQAFRWFREKYDLRIWIESNRGVLFYEYIIATTNPSFINRQFTNNEVFDTYEEAEQACLRKLIEIVKQNG